MPNLNTAIFMRLIPRIFHWLPHIPHLGCSHYCYISIYCKYSESKVLTMTSSSHLKVGSSRLTGDPSNMLLRRFSTALTIISAIFSRLESGMFGLSTAFTRLEINSMLFSWNTCKWVARNVSYIYSRIAHYLTEIRR